MGWKGTLWDRRGHRKGTALGQEGTFGVRGDIRRGHWGQEGGEGTGWTGGDIMGWEGTDGDRRDMMGWEGTGGGQL